jgi:hypothetical protein
MALNHVCVCNCQYKAQLFSIEYAVPDFLIEEGYSPNWHETSFCEIICQQIYNVAILRYLLNLYTENKELFELLDY